MAIVHISTKAISRKAGQSSVASAAYRAGVILNDEKYNKSHDYSRKAGVMSADIILPSKLQAKGTMVSREEIWNKAEHVEIRKDSRVAREWLVNLPHELDEDKRKRLAHEFAQALADKYNVIADVCIHRPVMKEPYDPDKNPSAKRLREGEENPDPRNYHAHILVTTREAKLDADGSLIFDSKFKTPFEWSNKKRAEHNLQSSIQEIKDIRQLWVDMANKALAEHEVMPLDARSFKDQGLDRLPTIKMGVDATNMERKGINTDKGNENRAIRVINQRKEVTKLRKEDERHVHEYIEWTAHRHQQVVKFLDDSQQRIEGNQRGIAWATRKNESTPRRTRRAKHAASRVFQRIDATKRQVVDSEQGVDDRYREARSRQEEFDRATQRTRTIISGRAKYLLAVFARPTEQGFDERQLATFNAFAAEKRFQSLEDMRVFFSDYDNAKQHKAFISMMLYPEKERKAPSEAHQSLETSLAGNYTNLESKALEIENRANISLPNEPTAPVRRKYRP